MILISSCLVGHPVRYDGRSKTNEIMMRLIDMKKAIHACPEILGGLTVPRAPAEIVGGDGDDCLDGNARVVTIHGTDVTAEFIVSQTDITVLYRLQCVYRGIKGRQSKLW